MEYRYLGKSGLQASAIGLGTNNFGRRLDADASASVINHALDMGVNMIDTSNSYGDTLSEEYIGRALRGGKRNNAILATKVSSRIADGPNNAGNSRQHILTEVDNSLRRLQTDWIDLYQIHWHDPHVPIAETLRALDDLVRQGKVRYIGCSNFTAWQACEAQWTARIIGATEFASVQPEYSIMDRSIEAELLPFCEAYGLGVLPYFPLANGFLTGKYRRGAPAPDGSRLAGGDRGMFTDANFDLLERLEAFCGERGHTILELAFAWLLAKPAVSSVIAGATRPEQIVANAKSAAWTLAPDELAEANRIIDGA